MPKTDTRVLTAHVPVPLAEKVDQLADRLERSRGWIMKQAQWERSCNLRPFGESSLRTKSGRRGWHHLQPLRREIQIPDIIPAHPVQQSACRPWIRPKLLKRLLVLDITGFRAEDTR